MGSRTVSTAPYSSEFFCWVAVRLYGTPVMAQVPILFAGGGRTTLNLSIFIPFISQLAGTTLPQPHSPIRTICMASLLLAANSGNFIPFLCSLNTPSLAQIFVIGDLLGTIPKTKATFITCFVQLSIRPYSTDLRAVQLCMHTNRGCKWHIFLGSNFVEFLVHIVCF
jgi:hypothetical protein